MLACCIFVISAYEIRILQTVFMKAREESAANNKKMRVK
jgi:hypothetical protein